MELQDKVDFGIAMEGPTGTHFVGKWYHATGIRIPGALYYRNGDTKPVSVSPSYAKFTRTYLREFVLQKLEPRHGGEDARRASGRQAEEGNAKAKTEDGFPIGIDVGQLTSANLPRLCPRTVSCEGNRCQETLCAILLSKPTFIDMRASVYLDIFTTAMQTLARKSASGERKVLAPVRSSWIDGVQQTGAVTAIGAEQGHLPLLLAVRPRSGRYARLDIRDSVTSDFVAHWLVEASAGRVEWKDLPAPLVDVIGF